MLAMQRVRYIIMHCKGMPTNLMVCRDRLLFASIATDWHGVHMHGRIYIYLVAEGLSQNWSQTGKDAWALVDLGNLQCLVQLP